VYHTAAKFKFEYTGIYGPADHAKSGEFLEELELNVTRSEHPVVGGDFNLIRGVVDKNNFNINWPRVHMFDDYIARLALREFRRTGARFTWTNNQLSPMRSVLDRFFVSPEWKAQFPAASLWAETRIGSDHTPWMLDFGEGSLVRYPRLFFKTNWFALLGFPDLVKQSWEGYSSPMGVWRDKIDQWNLQIVGLRRFLRGWGANLGKQNKVAKANLLAQIQELDREADSAGLDEEEWAFHYHLEDQLMQILSSEEEY
jgi:hypothetical protein